MGREPSSTPDVSGVSSNRVGRPWHEIGSPRPPHRRLATRTPNSSPFGYGGIWRPAGPRNAIAIRRVGLRGVRHGPGPQVMRQRRPVSATVRPPEAATLPSTGVGTLAVTRRRNTLEARDRARRRIPSLRTTPLILRYRSASLHMDCSLVSRSCRGISFSPDLRAMLHSTCLRSV